LAWSFTFGCNDYSQHQTSNLNSNYKPKLQTVSEMRVCIGL
jgi:hypothetical protein